MNPDNIESRILTWCIVSLLKTQPTSEYFQYLISCYPLISFAGHNWNYITISACAYIQEQTYRFQIPHQPQLQFTLLWLRY